MSIIHILPDRVANQIAAGEVVERPASIVKELLENSLDAGAARVEINVEAGGKRLIRVTDDGCGMGRDDALLAFERHATSKIRQAEDLLEIATLGFRGEALPSIAAVSRLVLDTRHASESSGTRVEIAGGRLRDVREVAWSAGTRIEARDLFFNTPARRKFLKSESTELGHIASFVTHYALAHPEKSFFLASMTHELVNAPPAPDPRTRVYQLLGAQVLEQLIEIVPAERRLPALVSSMEIDEEAEPAGIVRLAGFVSRPEVQRLNRNEVFFFVNRRLVRDRLILHAITEAFRNILPARMFPVALVFLEIPPKEVDVNVHPSKTEVRFRHSSFVHDFTRDVIRGALIAARPVAAFPLRRAAPEVQMEDIEAREMLAEESTPPPGKPPGIGANFSGPGRVMGRGLGPRPERGGISSAYSRLPFSRSSPSMPSGVASPVSIAMNEPAEDFALSSPRPEPITDFLPLQPGFDTPSNVRITPGEAEGKINTHPSLGSSAPMSAGVSGVQSEIEPNIQDGRPTIDSGLSSCAPTDVPALAAAFIRGDSNRDVAPSSEFPADLRPLGQVEESYIVATNSAGLWIVDQHAAHERILFERHVGQVRSQNVEAQRLLLPVIIELKPSEEAIFAGVAEELAANGFEAEPFGQRTVAVKTAPAELPAEDVERLLAGILEGAARESRSLTMESLRGRISASLACRAAIKIHTPLDRAKMAWLLGELARAESPMACPHGRPVMLRYSIRDLERAFRRT